jgi:uncharacterized membrane protein
MDAASVPALRLPSLRLGWRLTPLRLAVALTVFALAVRAIGIGIRPMWLDEAFSAWFSAQSWDYLWHVVPTYEAHPPFYYSLLKLWRGLFGGDAAALRSLSVLLSIATVPVTMLAAFEQDKLRPTGHGLLAAGLAGFLVAASPMLVILGQEPRPYPLLTLAYAVAILALLRLLRQFRDGGPGSWPSWLMLAGAAELVLWSHGLGLLYGISLALALAPAWLGQPVRRGRVVRGLTVAAFVAALYLPCLLMMAGRAQDWGTNWLGWKPDMLLQLLVLYSVPVEALTIGSAVAALAMILLIKRAVAFALTAKGWTADRALLLLWLGPPLLAAAISAAIVPVFLARTLSGTLVPAYLLIGAAIARGQSPRERRLITAAICITLAPTAVIMSLRPAQERWDLAAAYLARNVQPGDEVWLYPADSALPLNATGRFIPGRVRAIPQPFPTLTFDGPIRAGWPAVKSVTPGQARDFAADPAVRRVHRIWLVTRQSGIFDPAGDMPRALGEVRAAGPIQEWGYIAVRPYDRHAAHEQ